jgi:type II secretory pathway component PulF
MCQQIPLTQRFSNFFHVGTTFISQNVLRTTLLFSALKANCLKFSTVVCDTQFTLILFLFFVFFGLMFNLRGLKGRTRGSLVVRGPQFEKRCSNQSTSNLLSSKRQGK